MCNTCPCTRGRVRLSHGGRAPSSQRPVTSPVADARDAPGFLREEGACYRFVRASRDGERRAPQGHDARVPPHVVAEVTSPRPRDTRRDRVDKPRDYARAGVPYYWLVD